MDIGRDNGGVVDRAYEDRKPFAFTGTVKKVTFDIKPHLTDQDELDVHTAAQRGHAAHACRARDEEDDQMANETTDVLIGGYLSTDAAHEDYEAVLDCGAEIMGAVVVSKDLEGNLSVEQTDHMVKEGAEGLGAVGFAVGLFAPPLLAATAIGAVIGAGAGKVLHKRTRSKIEEEAGETIPIGGAGLIVAYKHGDADEDRARRDARDQEGRRRGRGAPRAGAQGRARRRPAEDGELVGRTREVSPWLRGRRNRSNKEAG